MIFKPQTKGSSLKPSSIIALGDENDVVPIAMLLHGDDDFYTMIGDGHFEGTNEKVTFLAFSFDDERHWLAFRWELAWEMCRSFVQSCEHLIPIGEVEIEHLTQWAKDHNIPIPPPQPQTSERIH